MTLMLGLTLTATSCSDDDKNEQEIAIDLDYSAENAASWHNYMKNVATLLRNDAGNLYSYWQRATTEARHTARLSSTIMHRLRVRSAVWSRSSTDVGTLPTRWEHRR